MFKLSLGGVAALFSKFFSAADRTSVVEAVRAAGARRVVFLDTPATHELVETIRQLVEAGVEVVVRDHHDVEDAELAKGGRSVEIRAAADAIRGIVGSAAVISTRRLNPACSSLITSGEFAPEVVNPAGFTTELDYNAAVDAAVLDGPRAAQSAETLSPLAWLLVRGMGALPPFNPDRAAESEAAKAKLFGDWVEVVRGDADAKARLEVAVATYEHKVSEARRLAATATEPVAGVFLVDTVGQDYDLGELVRLLEARSGCCLTVIAKGFGPIAKAHGGRQYSLAVVKARQEEVDVKSLLPEGFASSPETGMIANTTFMAHVSQKVWEEIVLPALRARFGG